MKIRTCEVGSYNKNYYYIEPQDFYKQAEELFTDLYRVRDISEATDPIVKKGFADQANLSSWSIADLIQLTIALRSFFNFYKIEYVIETEPTAFYETEEGRFCNYCFNPKTYCEELKEEINVFDREWDDPENERLYDIIRGIEKGPTYNSLSDRWDKTREHYSEYPECECCHYLFKDVDLLTREATYEQGFCTCGKTDIVATSLRTYYDGDEHILIKSNVCTKCNEQYHEQKVFESYKYLAGTGYRFFVSELKEKRFNKEEAKKTLAYMQIVNENKGYHLDREDYRYISEVIFIEYLLSKE